MANHTTLPIYKVAYDLLNIVTELVKNMPRDFKRSIGGKIADECVEIVVNELQMLGDKAQEDKPAKQLKPASNNPDPFDDAPF